MSVVRLLELKTVLSHCRSPPVSKGYMPLPQIVLIFIVMLPVCRLKYLWKCLECRDDDSKTSPSVLSSTGTDLPCSAHEGI